MANSLIPYSFIPGTKAMASEVNANLVALADAVDESKTFTTESIEEFNADLETRLDESLGVKLEIDMTNCQNISNCILGIPQDIKYEIPSTGGIVLKAGSRVYVSTGGVYGAVELTQDTEEGGKELWMSDNSRPLFLVYVPEDNIVVSVARDYTYSQATAPTNFLAGYALWEDTNNNEIKCTYDAGVTWKSCSLPLMIGYPGGTNIGWRGFVTAVFNGMGFFKQKTFVLPGVKYLVPNGLYADGTFKNTLVTVSDVIIHDMSSQSSKVGFLNGEGKLVGLNVTAHYEQAKRPVLSGATASWYDTVGNLMYVTNDTGVTWQVCSYTFVGKLYKSAATASISSLDGNEVAKLHLENSLRNKQVTYDGLNWYRVHPDGLKEQGGVLSSAVRAATFTVPFSNTNYTLMTQTIFTTNSSTAASLAFLAGINGVATMSKTGFTRSGNNDSLNTVVMWYARGY